LRKWRWKGRTAGAMREEEDGGGGVGRTVNLPPLFISPLGICVKSQPSTAKWKRPG
jgi:hypothetical protein